MEKKEIKKQLELLEELRKKSDLADLEYELEPHNKEKELAFDKAYEEEFYLLNKIIFQIVSITNGKISRNKARKMIFQNKEEVVRICKESESNGIFQ